MSNEEPQFRRALVIWYDDDTNTVEVDASAFGWLELPTLLQTALDYAEMQLPSFDYETESPDE
jgi:hypothetical protein